MNETLATDSSSSDPAPEPGRGAPLVLVIAWYPEDPARVGEVLVLPPQATARVRRLTFGRGSGDGDRLVPFRVRPGVIEPRPPLESARLSRDQLVFEVGGGGARARNVGRAALTVDGIAADAVDLAPGQVLEIVGRLLLLVEHHPVAIDSWPGRVEHPFGFPDPDGIVGESVAAWELRRELDFLGPRGAHVLVRGPSGSGKELVAGGLHRRSGRRGALVSRNATTLPPGLVDAELFGNVRGYPNPGMPARPGLVGAARDGTLFLDEVGDLPEEVQPHLLRLLDRGEYQTLGDHRSQVANLRVVAATHRPTDTLRHDLLARFPLRIELSGLTDRRADLPLLAAHLLRRIASREPDLGARFLDPAGHPRLSAALVRALLLRPWTTHARELEALLWASMLASRGDELEPPPGAPLAPPTPEPVADVDWRRWIGCRPEDIPASALVAALDAHGAHQERTAAALGLSSRYVLVRLLRRHAIPVVRRAGR